MAHVCHPRSDNDDSAGALLGHARGEGVVNTWGAQMLTARVAWRSASESKGVYGRAERGVVNHGIVGGPLVLMRASRVGLSNRQHLCASSTTVRKKPCRDHGPFYLVAGRLDVAHLLSAEMCSAV